MSAVAGALCLDGSIPCLALVKSVISGMQERAPDGTAYWEGDGVALAQGALWANPIEAANRSPGVAARRDLVMVFDGRVDNRNELHRQLEPGLPLRKMSDAHLALEAYARWGRDYPRRVQGEFACAIWDRDRQCLFCARDLMGSRPFAFVHNRRCLAFASDWEALLCVPGVSTRPNEDRIAGLLLADMPVVGDRRTWQRDVSWLHGGELLTADRDGTVRIERYRSLEPWPHERYRSKGERRQQFLEVFGEAVRCRLQDVDYPAVMMSGGLDSAAIVATALRMSAGDRAEGVHAYSAVSDHPEADEESRAIRSLARLRGVEAHTVRLPSFDGMVSAADLTRLAWSRPHPVDNWILLPALMCLAASREGRRVLLHGAGGDLALWTPERYPADLIRRARLVRAWRECRKAARNHVSLRGTSVARLLAGNVFTALAPLALSRTMGPIRRQRRAKLLDGSVINRKFAEESGYLQRLEEHWREQDALPPAERNVRRPDSLLHAFAATSTAAGRVAARSGVELRDPWSDSRVVELLLGLPLEFKVREGWSKYPVRRAFEGVLSPEVLWRRDKQHLGHLCTSRLFTESRDLIDQLMREELSTVEKYVDVGKTLDFYRRSLDGSDPVARDRVFTVATLILWLKRVDSGHSEFQRLCGTYA